MAWHALKEGYDGYLRWAYDYWRLGDPFDARNGGNTAGDFSMIYRASNNSPSKILPSLRLIMLREGIQDFEKITVLKTILESRSDEYSREAVNSLNTIINKFGKTSGLFAKRLVEEGQEKIKEILEGGATAGVKDIKSENSDVVYLTLLTEGKSLILYLPKAKGLKTNFFYSVLLGK